jgi:hypothetical protein
LKYHAGGPERGFNVVAENDVMSGRGKQPVVWRVVLVLALAAAVGVVLVATLDADPSPPQRAHAHTSAASALASGTTTVDVAANVTGPTCGAQTASTLASVDTTVAQGIYTAELQSREVSADAAHVTHFPALLSALASNNAAAVREAVHAIVYTPHWHIVRLRVLQAGHVVADVGGPDVIAPVSGTLSAHGKTLGTYVMSVQDDVGYVKLVSRFIGVPVNLYRNGSFLMGTLEPAPAKPSNGTTVHVDGVSYLVQLLSAHAFPSGPLGVALFIPAPSRATSSASCAAVRLAAWGSVATHVAARLQPLPAHYQSLVDVLHDTTGAPAYVRAGSTRIAGGSVPARLPSHGIVKYGGSSWAVFSWEAVPPARIYFLTPLS